MELRERFSLLLLDPGEIYFEDYAVDYLSNDDTKLGNNVEALIGSLKVCSKSLVFEPRNIKLPLIKLRYADCYEISKYANMSNRENLLSDQDNCMTVGSTQCIEMLDKNIISPYEVNKKNKIFNFKFLYTNIDDILPFCQQLHRAASLSVSEQNGMISLIAFSFHNRKKFNPLWLGNIYEKKLYDCKVDEVRPLVLNPGRLLLTNSCIYFQPFNNIFPYPVLKIKLSEITGLVKRRFLLRQIGLEIKWKDKNLYVSFKNPSESKEFCELAERQSEFNLPQVKQESMTLKWQNRLITNYEYLLYLNSLADRTFEDLTQYPVFPWVLTDYTSLSIDLQNENIYRDLKKPIGALNPERLDRLKERALEMDEPKYLYGSHYSNPGFVLFYLVRKVPHLMLCLQNGKFDCPNRMFNKVSDSFNNCLNNMADFKELIPEFYDTNSKGEFLQNTKKINFGCRSDGSAVNDVILPPWADNSPKKFISILREALESEYVSANLHHWIDLIFGYKQRGTEAWKADNVFHYNCYEGSVDLDKIKDISERHALEVQIYEFGQIPKQLFKTPHVSRNVTTVLPPRSPINNPNIGSIKHYKFELKGSYAAHKDEITSIYADDDKIWSTGKDGILKCYSILEKRQTRSISIGSLALSSCVNIPLKNTIIVGSWDNSIFFYDNTFGSISKEVEAHFDSVSCLTLEKDLLLLISGSWDCSVKIWRISNLSHIGSFEFNDRIICLDHRRTNELLQIAIGTEVGDIFLWDLKLIDIDNDCICTEPKLFIKHSDEVKCLKFNKSLTKLGSCYSNGMIMVNDIETGMEVFSTILNNTPNWLCWHGDLDANLITM
ncbi:protein FAN-like isoform X2 [Condylostylus longicornis]|uniref:protein FAN-like isoform X2 n=1 Tax=Condylostylus longicornis TaxID=2530218 RepID=UPI00244DA93A|nr:protein FAN-like isoform X2 [Condylostylus longicornis]